MELHTILTYPRSGANYLHYSMLSHTSKSIKYFHTTDSAEGTIITIARDPFESIHSHVTMRKHYHPDEGYNKNYNKHYIEMYDFLYDNANIVVDYKDLVESTDQVIERISNMIKLQKSPMYKLQGRDNKDRSYLVSSKTSPKYKDKHFSLDDIHDCYEPYTKLLSKAIDLTKPLS